MQAVYPCDREGIAGLDVGIGRRRDHQIGVAVVLVRRFARARRGCGSRNRALVGAVDGGCTAGCSTQTDRLVVLVGVEPGNVADAGFAVGVQIPAVVGGTACEVASHGVVNARRQEHHAIIDRDTPFGHHRICKADIVEAGGRTRPLDEDRTLQCDCVEQRKVRIGSETLLCGLALAVHRGLHSHFLRRQLDRNRLVEADADRNRQVGNAAEVAGLVEAVEAGADLGDGEPEFIARAGHVFRVGRSVNVRALGDDEHIIETVDNIVKHDALLLGKGRRHNLESLWNSEIRA